MEVTADCQSSVSTDGGRIPPVSKLTTIARAGAIPPCTIIKKKGDSHMQQNLERNHAMTFRVTDKERDLIRKAQARTKIKNTRAYLLKMAVDGRVIEIDLESVREMNRLLSNATNNINQIAKAESAPTGEKSPLLAS